MTWQVIAAMHHGANTGATPTQPEITMPRPLLWIITLAFGAYSLWALAQVGYLGLWLAGFANPGSTQITLDLIVSCLLLLGFVARDAQARGRRFWPWVLAVLALGSLGVLGYLLWPARPATEPSRRVDTLPA